MKLQTFAAAIVAIALMPLAIVLADPSVTALVAVPNPSVISNALANPQQGVDGFTMIVLGIGALIGWLWPTDHDNGSIPGRILNILKQLLTALAYIGQIGGFWKVKQATLTDVPTAPAPAPTAPDLTGTLAGQVTTPTTPAA